jgi:hypothetical protein
LNCSKEIAKLARNAPVAAALLLVLGGCREPNQNPLQSPAVAPQAAGPGGEGKAAMGGQSAPDAGAIGSTLCNIEYADGEAFGPTPLPIGPQSVVRGWLGHASGEPVAPRIVAVDAGGLPVVEQRIELGIERPDVVTAYAGQANLGNSGFQAVLGPLAGTPPYHLYLQYEFDQSTYICDNGRHVVSAP